MVTFSYNSREFSIYYHTQHRRAHIITFFSCHLRPMYNFLKLFIFILCIFRIIQEQCSQNILYCLFHISFASSKSTQHIFASSKSHILINISFIYLLYHLIAHIIHSHHSRVTCSLFIPCNSRIIQERTSSASSKSDIL